MPDPYFLGIDAGSRYTKFALMHDREIIELLIRPSGWQTKELAAEVTAELCCRHGILPDSLWVTATGYGRVSIDADTVVTEITCHAIGAHYLCPSVRTVIDVGGQDSKIICVDETGAVTDFLMNDKCAAGTGKFIEMMLQTLGAEFSTLDSVVAGVEPVHVTSTCAVFAESEIIGLMASGADRAAVLAGVIESAAARIGSLASRLRVADAVFFSGGLCRSAALRSAVSVRLGRDVITDENAPFAGAIGAALCRPK